MFCRWCACSVCEQWRKWNAVMFKIVLSKHKDTCICTCVFCDSDCVSIERLSPRYIMEHLLCPGERQFALSSVILYNWDCINNRYCTLLISHLLSKLYGTCWCYVSRCNTCFSNRRGTLFACPRNDLFSEQGLVEYECWERVDVTEQMWDKQQLQGVLLQCCAVHTPSISNISSFQSFNIISDFRSDLTKLTSCCPTSQAMG